MIYVDWQNIEFKNYDIVENCIGCFTEVPNHYNNIRSRQPSSIINIHEKYSTQQKLIKLLGNDTILHRSNGIEEIYNLFKNISNAYSQLKVDFDRQIYTLNNYQVSDYSHFVNYIEYAISNPYEKQLIISSCTQAIMSIPLICINKYYDLEQYVLGEINTEIENKSMYIDVDIDPRSSSWNIHIQKPLRIFDTYGTLYCILLDLDIDIDGLVVTIRPFL